jgi:hypothetical protein
MRPFGIIWLWSILVAAIPARSLAQPASPAQNAGNAHPTTPGTTANEQSPGPPQAGITIKILGTTLRIGPGPLPPPVPPPYAATAYDEIGGQPMTSVDEVSQPK